MLIRVCTDCGHTNLWLARQCGGCGTPFLRSPRKVSWRNLIIVWLLALALIAISGAGLYQIVLRLLPPLRALLFH